MYQLTTGGVSIAPSARLPDPADQLIVGQAPVTAAFRAGGAPSVQLVGTDQVGPQPNGWTYTVTYVNVPGNPAPWSFYLRYADGAVQNLSALAQVPAVQPGAQYLPLSGGTMSGPVAMGGSKVTGLGNGTAPQDAAALGQAVALAAALGG
jgi:hypothetical protein